MAGQQHRIARQTIVLDACARDEAPALQAAVSSRFEADWLPVLDRVLSRLGDPQRVLRIDRLEIDLGAVPAQALCAPSSEATPDAPLALLAHLEARLQARLAAALDTATAVSTDHELLACFLHSGVLPWWADAADARAVVRAIEALADADAALWRQLLAGDADQPTTDALRRLVAEAGPQRLAGLLARWRGAAGADDWTAALLPAWRAVLARTAAALAQPLPAWSDAWWQAAVAEALQPAAAGEPASVGGAAGWWPAVIARWLRTATTDTAAAHRALRLALDQPGGAADWPPALWQALQRRTDGGAPADDRLAERLGRALDRLAGIDAAAAPWQAWRDAWAGRWPQLPAALRRRVAAAAGQGHALAAALAAVLAELEPSAAADRLDTLARHWADALDPPAPVPAPLAPAPRGTAPQVEALYLAHAGLVLLWPFIGRFAERLGLLAEAKPARFRDDAAAARAVLLLHSAIAGRPGPDEAVPEHQLPLHKLLCGLPLDRPLSAIEPLTDAEHDEAEALLRAVIAQAPILRNQSSAGFRRSFGCRAGQLSARDGHGLLRVERQPWDVVLDRLPWGFGIVRLPWMPRLLQVEW